MKLRNKSKTTATTMSKPKRLNHLAYILAILLINELIADTIQNTIQLKSSSNNNNNEEEIQFNYHQGDHHHIVKRKSKGKLGRTFGFGKKPKTQSRPASNPYPKQPAYNPAYSPSSGSNPYPKQPAHNPNYMSGTGSNPVGPPPPYPGLGNTNRGYPQQSNIPHYPQQSNIPKYPPPGYGQHNTMGGMGQMGGGSFGHGNTFGGGNNMFGQNRNPFGGGSSYGSGFGNQRRNKGLGGIGKIGSAGFGALAGTALGAYGGYKLGRMVGNLGRMGHYGYYNDHGRYIKCDPPREIKVDPETNVSYIPLDDDYDKRCAYFDRPPPTYIEPSMLRSAATMITTTINMPMWFILIATILLQNFWTQRRFISISFF